MPHQCTTCDRTFADGSKQMLAGCPNCGGNKFQFLPADADGVDPSADPGARAADTPTDSSAAPADPARSTAKAAKTPGTPETSETPTRPDPAPNPPADAEDRAQASARRTVVSKDELPADEPAAAADRSERSHLAQLRAELNDQFESIRIVRPGQYELNLMELYDREEYIIALEEDGRYVIDVLDSWRDE